MFGKKAAKIRSLEASNESLNKYAVKWSAKYNEAYQELLGIREKASDYDQQKTINQALADENRDLIRRLELMQALLKQISINVALYDLRGGRG